MVGPVTEGERSAFLRKAKVGITVLVGLSAGLVALTADASLPVAGAAVVGGLALGAAVAWYIVPDESPLTARRRRRRAVDRENPFADGGRKSGRNENEDRETGDRSRGRR